MKTYVVRLWLPDRPGALGQVASRIGAVRGDVVGIDILEREGGQAVDELVVELPEESLVEALVREVRQVDGVFVEEVRPLQGGRTHDPRLDALAPLFEPQKFTPAEVQYVDVAVIVRGSGQERWNWTATVAARPR